MAARGVSPSDVRDALAKNNYLSALGSTKGSMVSVNLIANTDLRTPDEFQADGHQASRTASSSAWAKSPTCNWARKTTTQDVRFNGETATFMGIWVLPTANSLDVIKNVRKRAARDSGAVADGHECGHSVRLDGIHSGRHQRSAPHADRDAAHRRRRHLPVPGSFRSVLIPVVAIPISLIGAVFLMLRRGLHHQPADPAGDRALGRAWSWTTPSSMVENVERHLQMGKSPFQAAQDAARELVGPIIAMTITLAAVYAPIGIQGGLTGALFREFAFTLAGAVIVSGIVALTLSPMMGSKLLRAGDTERGFAGIVNRRFERVRSIYTPPADGHAATIAQLCSRCG